MARMIAITMAAMRMIQKTLREVALELTDAVCWFCSGSLTDAEPGLK